MTLSDAVERAIDECIRGGVLKEFLEKHRAEAREMSILSMTRKSICGRSGKPPGKTGRAVGVKEGHSAGLLDGAKKTAKKLFKLGLPLDTIADTVDADIEEVQAWLAEENGEKDLS